MQRHDLPDLKTIVLHLSVFVTIAAFMLWRFAD